MNKTPATSRPSGQQDLGAPPRRLAMRAVRATLMVMILAAGCYLAYGFGRLWAEWRQARQPAAARQAVPAGLNSMAAVLPLAGQWSFAELNWNLRSNLVEPKAIAARLDALAASPLADTDARLPDVSAELLEYAENLQIKPTERAGNRVYRLNKPKLQAQLIVRIVEGRPTAVSLAAAYPHSEDQWQLLEMTPRASAANAAKSAPHLLPLPAGARRCGGRFADDARPLLELFSLDSNADELFAVWKHAGWVVHASGMGGPDDFSYLCARGDEVIYAWSGDERGSLQNLMLVRTPTSADTNP